MPFYIEVGKGRLTCKVSWKKSTGGEGLPVKQDLVDLIESKGIKGVDPATIEKAYDTFVKKGKLSGFLLAQGTAPTPPEDGKVKWLFDTTLEEIRAGKMGKTGRIDYRERRSFVRVDEDQLLGTWTPPVLGEPGIDVFGEPVQPPTPKENSITAGKNIRLSDDGTNCYSTLMGHVFASGFRVSVDKVYKVDGDVDFHTGNIHFPGNILISGNITEGFVVEAEGDIVVNGMVENAEVRASGSVVVKRGIIRKSRIIAKGDMEAEFIQDSYTECGGKLSVEKSIVKSAVNANEDITLASMHGANGIVGGVVNAGHDIITYCLGSVIGVRTKVCAGRNSKLFMRFKKLVSYGLKAKANIDRFNRVMELMKVKLGKQMTNMGKRKMEMAEKALVEQKKELDAVISELNEIKSEAGKFTAAKVKVFGTAHEGAEISVWGIMTCLEESVENSVFFFDNEKNIVTHKTLN